MPYITVQYNDRQIHTRYNSRRFPRESVSVSSILPLFQVAA